MSIDRGFVIEQQIFVRAVSNGHDVDVLEFRSGFAPVAVRENVMAPDFAAGSDLPARWHRPVKERVEARHAHAGGGWFHMFKKG